MNKKKSNFLNNQLHARNDETDEMKELIQYINKSLLRRDSENGDDKKDLKKNISRYFNDAKKLTSTLKTGLDKTYKTSTNKSSEIADLKDISKELDEKLKEKTTCIDSLEEEKKFLKKKVAQVENQYRLSVNELNAIQNRLKSIDNERTILSEENLNLKSGKTDSQNYCNNLNEENEKLLQKLQTLQVERDKMFADLHEQLIKTNCYSTECNKVENKCENLEHVIIKLRREYQDQTREINLLTRETDELKNVTARRRTTTSKNETEH